MQIPLLIDDSTLSSQIDGLLSRVNGQTFERQTLGFLKIAAKVSPCGPFQPDPSSLVAMVSRRIAAGKQTPPISES
jgi:hypothetical protein